MEHTLASVHSALVAAVCVTMLLWLLFDLAVCLVTLAHLHRATLAMPPCGPLRGTVQEAIYLLQRGEKASFTL